jgi:transposase
VHLQYGAKSICHGPCLSSRNECCFTSRGRKHIPTMPRGPELSVETRARILELHDIGWSQVKIAAQHSILRLTVRYTIMKARERASKGQGQASLPRQGAPRVITEDERDMVMEASTQNPYITHEELQKEIAPHSSVRTIQRLCYEMDRRKWMCLHWPALIEEHAATRLQWAQRYSHFTYLNWRRVR